jgi:hypothetical protein
MTGKKTGGRQKGTPNRRTKEVLEILAELDCDPIEGMARIAMDEKHSPELRGRMLSALAEYCYPRRKAVEVTTIEEPKPSGEPVSLLDVLSPQELSELKSRVLAAQAKKVSGGEVAASPVGETVN